MRENNYKPQMPDVMEAIFDAAYLIFDLVVAVLFFIFSKGNTLLLMIPKTCAYMWIIAMGLQLLF